MMYIILFYIIAIPDNDDDEDRLAPMLAPFVCCWAHFAAAYTHKTRIQIRLPARERRGLHFRGLTRIYGLLLQRAWFFTTVSRSPRPGRHQPLHFDPPECSILDILTYSIIMCCTRARGVPKAPHIDFPWCDLNYVHVNKTVS